MAKQQKHIIDTQIVELEIEGASNEQVAELQQRFIQLFIRVIGEEMDRVFSKIAPPDITIRIDKLEIDLGNFSAQSMEQEVKQLAHRVIEKAIHKALIEKGIKAKKDGSDQRAKRVTEVDVLEGFLRDGHYPSWADPNTASPPELLQQLLIKKPEALARLIFSLSRNKQAIQRLLLQFSNRQLRALLVVLYQKKAPAALEQLQLVRRQMGRINKGMSRKLERGIYEGAIRYLFQQKKKSAALRYDEKEFTRSLILSAQRHVSGDKSELEEITAVQPDAATRYTDVEVIEYFLRFGSIPVWAKVDSRDTMQSLVEQLIGTKLVALQQMIEKNVRDEVFMRRLLYQFPKELIFQLLTPTPAENLDFIEQTAEAMASVLLPIATGISKEQLQETVLRAALHYFFGQRRSRFVRQSFLRHAFEKLAQTVRTDSDTIAKEFYKRSRQTATPPRIHSELQTIISQMDDEWVQEMRDEVETAERLRGQQTLLERELEQLERRVARQEASPEDLERLQVLAQQLGLVEYSLQSSERLSDTQPSPMEIVLQARLELEKRLDAVERKLRLPQRLQEAQLQQLEQSKREFSREWQAIERRFERFQRAIIQALEEQLEQQNRLEAQLAKASDSQRRLTIKKLERSRSRLARLQSDWRKAFDQLQRDHRSLDLRIVELQAALRKQLPPEQRQLLEAALAQSRERLAAIEARIEAMQAAEARWSGDKSGAQRVHPDEFPTETTEPTEEEKAEAVSTSKLDFLMAVLQYGSIPWWAEEYRKSSLQEVLLSVIEDNVAKFRQAMQQVGKNPVVWERLTNQLSEDALEQVLGALHPGLAGLMITQVLMLERVHQARVFPQIANTPLHYFKWSKVLELALSRNYSSVNPFVRDVVVEMAREYRLSPTELMQYLGNISRNVEEPRYQVFEHILPSIEKDNAIAEAEAEFKQETIETPDSESEQTRRLSDQEKLEVIVHFLQTEGDFLPQAKQMGWDNLRSMERLLLEQLDANAAELFTALPTVLTSINVRQFVLRRLRPAIFWELVQFLRPEAITIFESYLRDLSRAMGDPQLEVEKEALLDYALQTLNKELDAKEAVKYILQRLVQKTRRTPLAILEEWRQKLQALGSSALKSSILLSVLALEAEWFSAEQKKATDNQEAKRIQEQLEKLHQAYQDISQQLVYVLHYELVGASGVPPGAMSVPELFQTIETLEKELAELDDALKTIPTSEVVRQSDLLRQKAQIEAQLAIWERKKPALLRYIAPLREEMEQEVEQAQAVVELLREAIKRVETEMPALPTPPPAPELEERALVQIPRTDQGGDPLPPDQIERWEKAIEAADDTDFTFIERMMRQLRAVLQQVPAGTLPDYERLLQKAFEKYEQAIFRLSPEGLQTEREWALGALREHPARTVLLEAQSFISTQLQTASITELRQQWQRAEEALIVLQEALSDVLSADTLRLLQQNQSRSRQLIEQERKRRQAVAIRQMRQATQQLAERVRSLQSVSDAVEMELQLAEWEKDWQALKTQQETLWQERHAEAETPAERQEIERVQARIAAVLQELYYEMGQQRLVYLHQQREQAEHVQQQRERELQELEWQGEQALETAERQQEAQEKTRPEKEKRPPVELPAKKVKIPLLVRNAGLVILWPYITRLFKLINYSDGKVFLSEDAKVRGVLLLQYLATGQTSSPENELVLNKIMCSLPVSTPVPTSVDFTPDEIKAADGLLLGAIGNWSKMKTMSPAALRGTFILRTGNIVEEADRWRLTVDKGPYDIILKTLPWGYTFVKFQWMDKFITVDWG